MVGVVEMRFWDGMCEMAWLGWVKNRIPIQLDIVSPSQMLSKPPNELPPVSTGGIGLGFGLESNSWDGLKTASLFIWILFPHPKCFQNPQMNCLLF
jgi:hypothetical protein